MTPILILTALALMCTCGANITRRCTRLSWIPDSLLSASCANDKGALLDASIDLNDCIGFETTQRSLICGFAVTLLSNIAADLFLRHGYTATCRSCALNPNTHIVCCDCGDVPPNSGLTCINFNQFVCSIPFSKVHSFIVR